MGRHIVVISDLHLGGSRHPMMSRPIQLAHFIRELPKRAPGPLELVIAGDFVDFLAVEPFAAWTPDPDHAVAKLDSVMRYEPFACVFEALAALLASDHSLAVLVGNHDIELAMPPVQDALVRQLCPDASRASRITFYDDNRAYRAGGLLVEHGNRYDGANENDWTTLRAIASALSRYEQPDEQLEISAGSKLVEKLVSPMKAAGYTFIDLLQPQGELLALLLLAFEPVLTLDAHKIASVLRANHRQRRNRTGAQPGETRHVAFRPDVPVDAELAAVFGDAYLMMRREDERVSVGDLVLAAWSARQDSLCKILERGDSIPARRLEQIRVAISRMVASSGLQLEEPPRDTATEQYGLAAQRILDASRGAVQAVVMGHTHLPKHVGDPDRATYVNTGTWADVIRMPAKAIEPGHEAELEAFLTQLNGRAHRRCPGTFCDVQLDGDGNVTRCRLDEVPQGWF